MFPKQRENLGLSRSAILFDGFIASRFTQDPLLLFQCFGFFWFDQIPHRQGVLSLWVSDKIKKFTNSNGFHAALLYENDNHNHK